MDVQRIEWVSDLMGHAGSKQRERLRALRLDCFLRPRARFRGVVNNQCHPVAATTVSVERCGVNVKESRLRICDFEFVARNARASGNVHLGKPLPVQLGNKSGNKLAFSRVWKTEEADGGIVEIRDAS